MLIIILEVFPLFAWSRGKVQETSDEKEAIVYADIDLAEVDRVRQQIPITTQKRWDLYSITDKTK